MALTVAAVQMAMVDDVDENVDRPSGSCATPPAEAPVILLIPELFEGPYFCKDMLPEHFDRARPARRPSDHRALPEGGRRAGGRPAAQLLRAGQPGAPTTRSSSIDADGTRARHVPQEPHPRRARLHREVLLQPRRHGLPRLADAGTARSASASAGTSGSRRRPGRWRCSAPRCCSSRPPSAASRPTRRWDSAGHWQRVMQGHAGANLMPLVAANRVGREVGETHRDHVLRLVVHRRLHRGDGGRGPPRAARPSSPRRSTSPSCTPAGLVGPVPRPPPATCTARSATSDGHTR